MYIKKTDGFLSSPQDLTQTFKNDFNLSVSNNEVLKMYQNKTIQRHDLLIAEFLLTSVYTTPEQVQKHLANNGIVLSLEDIQIRLDKLVQYRILNKFFMTDEEVGKEDFPVDALVVYCLDLGGNYLLQSYSMKNSFDWKTGYNLKCSGLVLKALFCNEFRLKAAEVLTTNLNYFRYQPRFSHGKTIIVPTLDLGIKDSTVSKFIIANVFTEQDTLDTFDQVIKTELLLSSNAYKKYFGVQPIHIIIADNDYTAQEIAIRIQETKIADITRYTTEDRIRNKQLSELGAFLKFIPEEEVFKPIIAGMFRPQ